MKDFCVENITNEMNNNTHQLIQFHIKRLVVEKYFEQRNIKVRLDSTNTYYKSKRIKKR